MPGNRAEQTETSRDYGSRTPRLCFPRKPRRPYNPWTLWSRTLIVCCIVEINNCEHRNAKHNPQITPPQPQHISDCGPRRTCPEPSEVRIFLIAMTMTIFRSRPRLGRVTREPDHLLSPQVQDKNYRLKEPLLPLSVNSVTIAPYRHFPPHPAV